VTAEREQASGLIQKPYKGEIQVYTVQPAHHRDRDFCVIGVVLAVVALTLWALT